MLRIPAGFVAVLSLIACLVFPLMFFLGALEADLMKTVFLVASIAWLATATLWFRDRDPGEPNA